MKRIGFIGEMARFIVREKKWWMIPIIAAIALLSLLALLSGSPVAPLLYPLF